MQRCFPLERKETIYNCQLGAAFAAHALDLRDVVYRPEV